MWHLYETDLHTGFCVGGPERKRQLGRHKHRCEKNIKMDFGFFWSCIMNVSWRERKTNEMQQIRCLLSNFDNKHRIFASCWFLSLHPTLRRIFMNLTFIGPNILIYFYIKTNQMKQCIKFILFWSVAWYPSRTTFQNKIIGPSWSEMEGYELGCSGLG